MRRCVQTFDWYCTIRFREGKEVVVDKTLGGSSEC